MSTEQARFEMDEDDFAEYQSYQEARREMEMD